MFVGSSKDLRRYSTNCIHASRVLCSTAISVFGIGHVSKLNWPHTLIIFFKCNVTHYEFKTSDICRRQRDLPQSLVQCLFYDFAPLVIM